MALTVYYQKISEKDAAVKVYGNSGSVIIPLADLSNGFQVSDTPKVSITSIVWTGGIDGVITIKRNNVIVMTLQTGAAGALEFSGQMMLPDDVESDSDIEVLVNNIQCELWLKLRKVDGYKSNLDIGSQGVYDNPNVAGK